MNYQIKDLIGKTFSELDDIILRKNFNDAFWKKHKHDPYLHQQAKLKDGNLFLFDLESDTHEFSGFEDQISFFTLAFDKVKTIQLILHLQDNHQENFNYFLSKDIPEENWDWIDKTETNQSEGLIQFKTQRLEMDKSIPFDMNKLNEYEIVGGMIDHLKISIYPSKKYFNLQKEFYIVEVW